MAAATERPSTVFAGLVLAALVAAAAVGPALVGHDPGAQDLAGGLSGPGAGHLLGQDKLGRDVAARLLAGARVSLEVAVLTVACSLLIGTLVGAVAGFAGGAVDFWLMRAVDVLLAFPGLLLAIALAAVLGPSLENVVIALVVLGWTDYARLVRGEVLSIRERAHVEAARALGLGAPRIVTRHVLPLLAAPLAVQASFSMASAIVAEAGLSFLGLGVQPPRPSWGSMLAEARSFVLVAPHLVLAPGAAITLVVLALNFLGEDLRDHLDVRRRPHSG
jgi:peptide/nickel transport system permease protein